MKAIVKILAISASCVFLAGGTASAQGEAGEGMTLAEASALLEGEGLDVSRQSDGSGDYLQSSVSGGAFTLEPYNCNSAGRCTEFLFAAGFDLSDGFSEEKINDWNSTRLGGRAYLDEERDPYLDHVVSVSGPADAGAFREGFYLWAEVLAEFMSFIDLPFGDVAA